MRRVSPSVAVFCRKACTCGGSQFVAEELVLSYALASGELGPYGCGQCRCSVNLLDEEIYGGETGKMEVAILRVGGGGVVVLSDEMEHALTFVVKGNGSHLTIL